MVGNTWEVSNAHYVQDQVVNSSGSVDHRAIFFFIRKALFVEFSSGKDGIDSEVMEKELKREKGNTKK